MQRAIPAVLLGLLRDNGTEELHKGELVAVVGPEEGLRAWECAEHEVGEGLREGDGGGEVGDREVVEAGGDGGGVCAGEDAVDTEGVELFLLGCVSGVRVLGGLRVVWIGVWRGG